MSVADNLHTNASKVRYTNYYPSDVVVTTDTATVTNSGYDCVTHNDSQGNNLTSSPVPNTYGKRCIVRYVWSIDGLNFNAAEDYLLYTFTVSFSGGSTTLYNVRAAVEVSCDEDNIIFKTASGYHGNATIDGSGNYSAGSPISQIFTIKYALIGLDE